MNFTYFALLRFFRSSVYLPGRDNRKSQIGRILALSWEQSAI